MMRWGAVTAILLAGCSPAIFADVESAQSFTKDTVLPAIGEAKIDSLLSPIARKATDPVQTARWLRIFAQLGPLKSAGEVTCQVTSGVNTNPDLAGEFANCAAQAAYANGAAAVTVRLRKVDDGWLADAINVNSDLFSKLMEQGLAPAANTTPAPPTAPAADPAPVSPTP